MKNLIYLLTALTLFGCANSSSNESPNISDREELVPETDKDLREEPEKLDEAEPKQNDSILCSSTSLDFLNLKDKGLQSDFFDQLDSTRKVQYPDNGQDTSVMVDLTPEYLNQFLSDINSDTLREKEGFEKEYHFNIAPKDFTDPEICKDKIAVDFDGEDCSFTLSVNNTFLVEPDWCTESTVIYGFKIENSKVIDFWRQEAG